MRPEKTRSRPTTPPARRRAGQHILVNIGCIRNNSAAPKKIALANTASSKPPPVAAICSGSLAAVPLAGSSVVSIAQPYPVAVVGEIAGRGILLNREAPNKVHHGVFPPHAERVRARSRWSLSFAPAAHALSFARPPWSRAFSRSKVVTREDEK